MNKDIKKYQRYLNQLGLTSSVIFTGFIKDNDLPRFYQD